MLSASEKCLHKFYNWYVSKYFVTEREERQPPALDDPDSEYLSLIGLHGLRHSLLGLLHDNLTISLPRPNFAALVFGRLHCRHGRLGRHFLTSFLLL